MPSKKVDVLVFGATGFTGQLVSEYLARQTRPIRWMIVGRNAARLKAILKSLQKFPHPPQKFEIAEAEDFPTLLKLAQQSKVILTTVGPYKKFGGVILKAAVEAGCDYVDLTGESDFVRESFLSYHELAQKKQIKIVHSCGFESVPFDLGALWMAEQMQADAPWTLQAFVSAQGSFSGGTWQSALGAFQNIFKSGRVKFPSKSSSKRKVRLLSFKIFKMKAWKAWACPLPTIEIQNIPRTARELDVFGPDFSYGHYALLPSTVRLLGGVVGVTGLVLLSQWELARNYLSRWKKSGEGPSQAEREQSHFKIFWIARSKTRKLQGSLSGGDPGYGETAKMISEAALALLEPSRLPQKFGVLTPALALGSAFRHRLEKVGLKFERED